jgi:hypothetical protein
MSGAEPWTDQSLSSTEPIYFTRPAYPSGIRLVDFAMFMGLITFITGASGNPFEASPWCRAIGPNDPE